MKHQKTFGQIVRKLREEKGLSREMVCGDERELTVRQLVRLENDDSMPTLPKIEYLAQRLAVPVYQLMVDYVAIPKRYLDLKYLIMRTELFGQTKLVAQKEAYLFEIYEQYYEDLPEEEQVAVDVLQSWVDVLVTGEVKFGERIVAKYIEEIQSKSVYHTNDLLVLALYFYCLYLDSTLFHPILYQQFVQCLLTQEQHVPAEQLFLLTTVYVTCIAAGWNNGWWEESEQLVKRSKNIMKQTQDFHHFPILHLQECQILFMKNRQLAEKRFKEIRTAIPVMGYEEACKKFEEWKENLLLNPQTVS